jgi:small nuclear ribonucleoprotein (snRNP)-like protein
MAESQVDASSVQVEAESQHVETQANAASELKPDAPKESKGREFLKRYLNRNLKIDLTDGRVLIGVFLCTDRDANIILGSCKEYASPQSSRAS